MLKLWKINDSNYNKLIAIKDQCIYIGNPKKDELNKLNDQSINVRTLEEYFSIPYSYIKNIETQKESHYIKIFYGNNSEEELVITNEKTRVEIFRFLRRDCQKLKYSVELPSILKYGKTQMFALLVITCVFLSSLYLANEIEKGTEFSLSGGIIGLVITIASLGVLKITVIFTILLVIALFALKQKLNSRSEVEILKR